MNTAQDNVDNRTNKYDVQYSAAREYSARIRRENIARVYSARSTARRANHSGTEYEYSTSGQNERIVREYRRQETRQRERRRDRCRRVRILGKRGKPGICKARTREYLGIVQISKSKETPKYSKSEIYTIEKSIRKYRKTRLK